MKKFLFLVGVALMFALPTVNAQNVNTSNELAKLKRDDIIDSLENRASDILEEKKKLFGEEQFLEVQRAILLQNVDRAWMEHIDAMDDLKDTIGLQSYAQRDPVTEYRIIGGDMFDAMVDEIRAKTVRMIMTVIPKPRVEIKRVQVANPITAGLEGENKSVKKVTIKRESAKVGRNDPCPCGSGKKYKSCCGLNPNSINKVN